jgi:hypothetical protein
MKNGCRDIRAALKSERAFHKRYEDQQRRKLEKQIQDKQEWITADPKVFSGAGGQRTKSKD